MSTFPEISNWLEVDVQRAATGKYEHSLCREDTKERAAVIPTLKVLISDAHEDARNRLRNLVRGSLDPLGEDDPNDPAEGYPEKLHLTTLKGCFGEILAGLVAANLNPFGHDDWVVPAYLFRFHLVEFQHLDMMTQSGEAAAPRPGRTGDDCLAFRRNEDGEIIAALFCEAKCTKGHRSSLVDDAHEKSSLPNLRPVDIPQLIEVLLDSKEPAAARWVEALRKLHLKGANPGPSYERVDQVTYVCGKCPSSKTQKTWITTDKPHAKYSGGRRLHVAEIHLTDVEDLIQEVYGVV
jgi:hypothetical protein